MSALQERTETIEERVARLMVRLERGYTMIGKQRSQGVPVDKWEDAWIELLHEYEALEDELAAAPPAPVVQREMVLGVPVRPVDRVGVL